MTDSEKLQLITDFLVAEWNAVKNIYDDEEYIPSEQEITMYDLLKMFKNKRAALEG